MPGFEQLILPSARSQVMQPSDQARHAGNPAPDWTDGSAGAWGLAGGRSGTLSADGSSSRAGSPMFGCGCAAAEASISAVAMIQLSRERIVTNPV
jgi:hypothetical protein